MGAELVERGVRVSQVYKKDLSKHHPGPGGY